jgi:hypothetical protein
MKRDFVNKCTGCCSIKRAGELYYICLFKECLFHPYHFGHNEQRENENGLKASTSFS